MKWGWVSKECSSPCSNINQQSGWRILEANTLSGKVARSSGPVINRKDLAKALTQIENGALIIEQIGRAHV